MITLFFDLEKAYDLTRRDPIPDSPKKWNKQEIIFGRQFPKNRASKVRYKDCQSEIKEMTTESSWFGYKRNFVF